MSEITGLRATLKNGATVTCWPREDGVVWEFERDGRRTPLALSNEAMECVAAMWWRLVLRADAETGERTTPPRSA